jgi:hypothetical protein
MNYKSYDKISLNSGIVLDLPHFEGNGNIVHDISKKRINLDAVNNPTWTNMASGNQSLTYNGTTQYLECPAADSVDLDFTGDYSLCCWVNPLDTGTSSIIMGRYELDNSGWELYFTNLGWESYLTLRHHHASLTPNNREGCYTTDWTPGNWWLLGISRSGLYPIMYRNGSPLTTTYGSTGMQDPDSCGRDLVVGVRYTKNTAYYKGQIRHIRAWDRALSSSEWLDIWNNEHNGYGV